ncbi:hypothetical protein [Hyphomicrobium sp.]|uniref:hypothetical protein n=1 Tax=Hyphomicrobium sp. TaxID=82 RepID=UPI003F6F5BFC
MFPAGVSRALRAMQFFTALLVVGLIAVAPSLASEPEFGGQCAMGLAEGKRIKTDCSVNWTAPDGKKFCFGNEDSRTTFLKDPDTNIRKATEQFAMDDGGASANEMGKFSAGDVQAFIEKEIASAAEKNGGLFPVKDTMLDQTLALKLVGVDFVRTLHGYGFFPNVVFADSAEADKKYQVDFWVKPKAGKLSIVDVRIYKAPRKEGDKWVQMTRQPKPWWWIPASEHPGESEVKRGWEIMSALHEHIAVERTKGGGLYKLKDDKTGEELSLDFVGIHQPVRKLKQDGRFFACTDFRKAGTKDQFYDIDFWLDEKSGKVTVGEVRVHKVPTLEDGNFVQIPRYSFDPKTFDVVP